MWGIALKLKELSLKWKLFLFITAFLAVMIFIIWLFQIVFLSSFYRKSKIDELHTSAQSIVTNLGTNDMGEAINAVVERSNTCVKVVNLENGTVIDVDRTPNCVLHYLSSQDLNQLYQNAKENNGTYLASFSRTGKFMDGGEESIVYTQTSGNYVVMLNTMITPVNATVSTLRSQLVYLSLIFGVLGLLFAAFISKRISKPIMVTNESAKELAKGNVNVHFDGEGYREITELNSTLNYAAGELAKVEKLQRELIANVSHDLRTPLTMITGYAEVIRDLPGENTPENVQIIIDEANRLAALVNDVLDISKLRAGVQDLDVEVFCLTDTIRQIMKRYTKLTEQDGYSITFEADSEVYAQGDELKITQVIYNLVNNAIHYTGADKRVVIRQTICDARVRIAVTDTGEGIAEDQLPYVWDRYYKIDKNHQLASVGTGLGLSIVKNILTLHGMPFGVLSTLNEGTTFWFEMGIAKECENGYTI